MAKVTWKDYTELIGIFAILVGLYFVYEEVRLNAVIARAEFSAETNRGLEQIDLLRIDPELAAVFVKAQTEPESLSMTERTQINAVLESVLHYYRRECYYRRLGVFSECESIPRTTAVKYFGSRYGRAFWGTVRNRMVGPYITGIVDEELAANPATDTFLEIDASVLELLEEKP